MQRTEATHLLRQVGLRVTAPRVAVLVELHAHPHTDTDNIRRGVLERLGSVSTQAVYDVLRTLQHHGLVRRVEPAGSPALYEINSGDGHHHLVCRSCHLVVDVPCSSTPSACTHPEAPDGFLVEETEIMFWGLCRSCRTDLPRAPARDDRPLPTDSATNHPTNTSKD